MAAAGNEAAGSSTSGRASEAEARAAMMVVDKAQMRLAMAKGER